MLGRQRVNTRRVSSGRARSSVQDGFWGHDLRRWISHLEGEKRSSRAAESLSENNKTDQEWTRRTKPFSA